MSPTLVFDEGTGELVISGGSPGGALIIHYTAKLLLCDAELATDTAGGDRSAQLRLAQRPDAARGRALSRPPSSTRSIAGP
jgi:hypothetical protein